MALVLDIETAPWPRALEVGPGEKELRAPSNWKDPAKIAAYEREKREEWESLAAVDWRTGQVTAFGALYKANGGRHIAVAVQGGGKMDWASLKQELAEHNCELHAIEEPGECELLRQWWNLVSILNVGRDTRPFVAFGGRRFDLPWLALRSALHGIEMPIRVLGILQKYRTDRGVVDLQEILDQWGEFTGKGYDLKRYAELFGLEHKPIAEGAEVPPAWQKGQYHFVARKVAYDVLATADLANRFHTIL